LLLATTITVVGITGCGSNDSDSPDGYVSVIEAKFYFDGVYGGRWDCVGHGIPDRNEVLVDLELSEMIEKAGSRRNLLPFRFVSCRLLSGARQSAREDDVHPGSVLTYGIP
jgi:hypothetical protein